MPAWEWDLRVAGLRAEAEDIEAGEAESAPTSRRRPGGDPFATPPAWAVPA